MCTRNNFFIGNNAPFRKPCRDLGKGIGEIAIKNNLQIINSNADLNRLLFTDRLTLEDHLREYLQSPFGILFVRAYCAIGKTTMPRKIIGKPSSPVYLFNRTS